MEKKNKGSVRILSVLVLGLLLAVQCLAINFDDPDCYAECINKCRKRKGIFGMATCGAFCAADCATKTSLVGIPRDDDHHYNCKLGCASSFCATLLNQTNPEMEKVGGCVDSCSKSCATNTFFLPPDKN